MNERCVLLTSVLLRTFDKPSDGDIRIDSGPNRFVPDIKFIATNRKLNVLEKNTKGVCDELEKLLQAEAAPTRIESQLRWLKTVSNTYIWIGRYNHCLSFDATIMVSKNCPIIGEHVVIIFLTQ